MRMELVRDEAAENFVDLTLKPYPGRGFIMGIDETGEYAVQVYWLMGRRESSRNRVLISEGNGHIRTELADPSKSKGDTSLILYNAMRQERGLYIVSNGRQTDKIEEMQLASLLDTVSGPEGEYEPDPPIFTPRITGCMAPGVRDLEFVVARKCPWNDLCNWEYYTFPMEGIPLGFGYCVHTYEGSAETVKSFPGKPFIVPILGDLNSIATSYWDHFNSENKVALAVKFISLKDGATETRIINARLQKKPAAEQIP